MEGVKNMIENYVESERGKSYYWISGEKNDRCLFFCHGITADHTLFKKQVEKFCDSYKVICMDTPMHGKSRPYKNFSYKNIADDIYNILKKESISKAIFAGQSLGGYNCQAFYKKHPEMVQAFISIDSTPFGYEYTSKIDRFWLRHMKIISKLYPYKMWLKLSTETVALTEESRLNFYNALKQYSKKELIEIMAVAYLDYLNYKEPVHMECPVLLILGDKDKVGKVAYYNRLWHQREGYPLIVLKDASHDSNYDNYQEFNRVVEEFIGGIEQ